MQKLLLCDIPIKSCKMLNIAMYDVIQNNFTEIWAVKDYNLCVLIWANQEEYDCSITPLFFHIFIEKKSVCHDCVWYDEDLDRIYQK